MRRDRAQFAALLTFFLSSSASVGQSVKQTGDGTAWCTRRYRVLPPLKVAGGQRKEGGEQNQSTAVAGRKESERGATRLSSMFPSPLRKLTSSRDLDFVSTSPTHPPCHLPSLLGGGLCWVARRGERQRQRQRVFCNGSSPAGRSIGCVVGCMIRYKQLLSGDRLAKLTIKRMLAGAIRSKA